MTRVCWLALSLACACTFDPGGVPYEGADAAVDAPGAERRWRDDSALDFGAEGSARQRAVIEPWGAIGPEPMMVGALVAYGYNDAQIGQGGGPVAKWDMLTSTPPAGTGITTLVPFEIAEHNDSRPPGNFGINEETNWTFLAEGEVWLEAGEHEWLFSVDDDGFFDLALPGTSDYQRVLFATSTDIGNKVKKVVRAAPVTGWYPLRIAMANTNGTCRLELQRRRPGAAEFRPLPAHRLRARVPRSGLIAQGFDNARLLVPRGLVLASPERLSFTFGTKPPADLLLRDDQQWSTRWTGQLRIDIAGEYQLRVNSAGGHRLWLDGAIVLDNFAKEPKDAVSSPIVLDAGWHDFALDLYQDSLAVAKLDVGVEAGPDAALIGSAIPLERLRPVVGVRQRVTGGADADAVLLPLPNRGQASTLFTMEGPPGARITQIDWGVQVDHPRWPDLATSLRTPDGASHALWARRDYVGNGRLIARFTQPLELTFPADDVTPWTVTVADDPAAASGNGTLEIAAVSAHYVGGPAPAPDLAAYESRVNDLGNVIGFDQVSWTARGGADVHVRLRSCAEAAACASAPWSEPLTSGQAPGVTAARFAQYRVELTATGDITPAVDAVEIVYRVAP